MGTTYLITGFGGVDLSGGSMSRKSWEPWTGVTSAQDSNELISSLRHIDEGQNLRTDVYAY